MSVLDLVACILLPLTSQIADILISSLLVDGTAVPRKVARLHLICDILHNSAISVHKAWKFRQEFQSRLPLVFDHLSTIYHSFPGKMTAEVFKKQIVAVVEVWEDWIVFPPEFTEELRQRLDGVYGVAPTAGASAAQTTDNQFVTESEAPLAASGKFKAASFQPAAADEEDLDGVAMDDDVDGEPADLDGEPFDGEPLDGEPLDGDPLDGEALDVDGELLGEDLDGESMQD